MIAVVGSGQSIFVTSEKPVVPALRPVFFGSMTQFWVATTSSHVIGVPSDQSWPAWSFHVTVIASPFWPRTTPPLLSVGAGSAARSRAYLKSSVDVTRPRNTAVVIVASMTWPW